MSIAGRLHSMQGVSRKNQRLTEIRKLPQMCCGSVFPSWSGSKLSSDSFACVGFCYFRILRATLNKCSKF